jgi:hypothetical protein
MIDLDFHKNHFAKSLSDPSILICLESLNVPKANLFLKIQFHADFDLDVW